METTQRRDLIKEADFDFIMPVPLQNMIHELEDAIANHSLIIDCIQDEIRSLSRMLDDEEEEEQIIEFFCRRRWLND